jgi:hypothetical protein
MKTTIRISILLGTGLLILTRCEEVPLDINDPVDIPDVEFLKTLLDEGIDTSGDGLVSYAEAESVKYLDLDRFSEPGKISDLTGIESFVNLESLILSGNNLISLDLSENSKLVHLDVSANYHLQTLNLTKNRDLIYLNNYYNYSMISLDLSGNSRLDTLILAENTGLKKVCVWTLPFPPEGLVVALDEDHHIDFTTDCGL